jgi:hypothetical protein
MDAPRCTGMTNATSADDAPSERPGYRHKWRLPDPTRPYQTKIFDKQSRSWRSFREDFSMSVPVELYGTKVPVTGTR